MRKSHHYALDSEMRNFENSRIERTISFNSNIENHAKLKEFSLQLLSFMLPQIVLNYMFNRNFLIDFFSLDNLWFLQLILWSLQKFALLKLLLFIRNNKNWLRNEKDFNDRRKRADVKYTRFQILNELFEKAWRKLSDV